ncbi:MAG: UDP-N-acetylmuramyl-tripeptide synthetase [Actinomycetaceae bacterium]|nr:UDP-N-acetylmuramyl-tripeptide synthetase [Actinomycetaceae bacterium]
MAHPQAFALRDPIVLSVTALFEYCRTLDPECEYHRFDGSTFVHTHIPPVEVSRSEAQQDVKINGATMDSRAIEPGNVFFAVAGATFHGAHFVVDVVKRGSRVIVTDNPGREIIDGLRDDPRLASLLSDEFRLVVLTVDDVRLRIGELSAWIYGDPSAEVDIIGVTGTNGKTTTTMMIRHACLQLDTTCGLIGTIHTISGSIEQVSEHTTLEAPAMQQIAAHSKEAGEKYLAIEVSSHGVAAHRTRGTRLKVLGFLNLQHDHLDFHQTMEAYFSAKAEPFLTGQAERAVICVNDQWGRRLASQCQLPTVTYAMEGRYDCEVREDVDYWVDGIHFNHSLKRDEFTIHLPSGRTLTGTCPIPGEHNIENQMMAVLCLVQVGFSVEDALSACSGEIAVPGRLERIRIDGLPDDAPEVYVDYAHTAEAVDVTLATLRQRCRGKLISIVGANGDRDVDKRPHMGYAAAKWSDIVHVCDDTPYNDDPLEVRKAISRGINLAVNDGYQLYYDVPSIRETAMWQMVRDGGPDDILVFLGRGHEDLQVIHGYDHFLLDANAARRMLQRRYQIEPETGRLYDEPLYAAIVDHDPRLCEQRLLMTISRAVNATNARLTYLSPRGEDTEGFFTLPAFALLFGARTTAQAVTPSSLYVATTEQAHQEIGLAVTRGATAVLVSDLDQARTQITALGKKIQQRVIPVLVVSDVQRALRDLVVGHLTDIRRYHGLRGRRLTLIEVACTWESVNHDLVAHIMKPLGEVVLHLGQGTRLDLAQTLLRVGGQTEFLVLPREIIQQIEPQWFESMPRLTVDCLAESSAESVAQQIAIAGGMSEATIASQLATFVALR